MIKKEEAIQLVIKWYEKAPTEDIDKIEKAIQMEFPYKELKEGLANCFENYVRRN